MRFSAILTMMLVSLTASAVADPSAFLAPDNPANGSGWRPPPPITTGLMVYKPVEPKNWLELRPEGAGPTGSMKGMPGMKMQGMGDGK